MKNGKKVSLKVRFEKSEYANIICEIRRLRIILEGILYKIELMLKSMSDVRRVSLLEKRR
ncbi:MAG: hypothetical protein Q7R89_03395 [bacterium]|nr:hypothetical protein [bacterium]